MFNRHFIYMSCHSLSLVNVKQGYVKIVHFNGFIEKGDFHFIIVDRLTKEELVNESITNSVNKEFTLHEGKYKIVVNAKHASGAYSIVIEKRRLDY